MDKILIIEDDEEIAGIEKDYLEINNMEVTVCLDAISGIEAAGREHFDLIILDLMLPGMDGFSACKKLRAKLDIPLIIVSARHESADQVLGLGLGADNFIAKPFDSAVLIAKIQALLRRAYDFGTGVNVLEHGGALLDTAQQTLCYGEKTVALSKNEFRILLVLMEHKGQVVSREMLMQKLWESESFVDENTLSVNVNRLRKRLEQVGLCDFIETKFGVGYLIRA